MGLVGVVGVTDRSSFYSRELLKNGRPICAAVRNELARFTAFEVACNP
jgi:hypothetical protein